MRCVGWFDDVGSLREVKAQPEQRRASLQSSDDRSAGETRQFCAR